ncbi:hypothetical protein OYT1_ch1762 [Ferriphaselus amnicola]|uniref:Uncharacterized protein n=1 Tax=Ferriphaselus amnicola TaxID=1188319 RepID=A0A2Z6GDP5_9PROT|nr:hypothetical protein OYT1_ch1762 [Ferriphaselus amnicola]
MGQILQHAFPLLYRPTHRGVMNPKIDNFLNRIAACGGRQKLLQAQVLVS